MTDRLSHNDLIEVIDYCADSGALTWRKRDRKFFSSTRIMNSWNSRYAGKEAITAYNYGYKHGSVLGHRLVAHRIAWCLHYGSWPDREIDHINGVRDDNRIANLRPVSPSENKKNTKKMSSNSSGYCGVSWDKKAKRWAAYIQDSGRRIFLGYHQEISHAADARQKAEVRMGYHENHGR